MMLTQIHVKMLMLVIIMYRVFLIIPHDKLHGSAVYAIVICLPVSPSVCHTRVTSVRIHTAKRSIKLNTGKPN